MGAVAGLSGLISVRPNRRRPKGRWHRKRWL